MKKGLTIMSKSFKKWEYEMIYKRRQKANDGMFIHLKRKEEII